MATAKDAKLNILTAEQAKQVSEFAKRITDSHAKLDVLEQLGLGVSDLRSKLNWAGKRADILLGKV
jgi:hypothetical protein